MEKILQENTQDDHHLFSPEHRTRAHVEIMLSKLPRLTLSYALESENAPIFRKCSISTRTVLFGTSCFDFSSCIVFGEVFLIWSQASILSLSYVWPSSVRTGSRKVSCTQNCCGNQYTSVNFSGNIPFICKAATTVK